MQIVTVAYVYGRDEEPVVKVFTDDEEMCDDVVDEINIAFEKDFVYFDEAWEFYLDQPNFWVTIQRHDILKK